MSLWVYIEGETVTERCECPHCFNNHTTEVIEELFSKNITHNLGSMANEAGIYMYIWRPEELHITKAESLIEPLTTGLAKLKGNPDFYKTFNPKSGWGNYENLVEFTESYLKACIEYPKGVISASR